MIGKVDILKKSAMDRFRKCAIKYLFAILVKLSTDHKCVLNKSRKGNNIK